MLIPVTMFDHKGYEPSMIIVHMDHIGLMRPCRNPINYAYLKSSEALRVITISVNLFSVEQPVYINQLKIKIKDIIFFLDDRVSEPPVAKIGVSFMHHFPFMSC